MQDFRFAVRLLLRNRTFAAIATAALALGIGANSAVFSVVYGVIFKPLPYRNPERLVRVYENNLVERFRLFPLSPADFLDYRRQSRGIEAIATYVRQDQQYGGERPERLVGARVSYGFFELFGAEPMLGRTFTREEEQTSGATDVAILSYNAWKRLLNGDPRAIGRTVRLTDYPFRVIGVMPKGFENVSGGYRLPHGETVDVWLPMNILGNPRGVPRAFHYCNTIARLRAEIPAGKAESEMNIIAASLERQYPDDRNWRIQLTPLQDDLVGKVRPTMMILAGAVGFVLLIACVNVANLLLARAAAREREMAIRAAVGATRGRLALQALTESLALAIPGGGLGLLLAWWGVRTLVALGPEQVPRLHSIELDARVVLVTAGLTVFTGLLFGLAPALAASTQKLRSGRPRSAFLVAEVALTFVLLTGAGLLLRSFLALGRVDPGFQPRGVLTLNTALSYPKLVGARRYAAFYEHFIDKLAQIPGVTAVGAASTLPWTGAGDNALIGIEGRQRPAGMSMHARYLFVSPDYLRAIGVPLLAGRWLHTSDHFDAPKVTMINRTLALQYWPSVEAAVGQRIYTMRDINTPDNIMTIVGVAGDVKDGPTDADAQPALYQPFLQFPSFGNYLAVRSTIANDALIPAVREVAHEMGNDLSIQEIRPMGQVLAAAVATQRFALQMLGLFAAIALALALIGIYGVMSYAASRRAREVAIRTALGATPRDAFRLLLGQGAKLIAAGVIAGGLGAIWLTKALAGILYQVSASDPWTFAAVAVVLSLVATAACLGPARNAMRTDPMKVLRQE